MCNVQCIDDFIVPRPSPVASRIPRQPPLPLLPKSEASSRHRPPFMSIHRDYFRPGEEGARPVYKLTFSKQKYYPEDVKMLCRKGSSARVPRAPQQCPRCGVEQGFIAQICYMRGVAGAFTLVVRGLCRYFSLSHTRCLCRAGSARIVTGQFNADLRRRNW